MKRYIKCTEDSQQFNLNDIKKALRQLRNYDYKVTIKNNSVEVTSYEGDAHYFARLADVLNKANTLVDPYLEDEILDIVVDVSEFAGAHHYFEVPEMKQRVAELREKYFNS